jgi:putative ABC transport system permease protein
MSIRRFMHRTRKDQDLAEEIASHLSHEQDKNIDRGLPPQEAQRQARLRFGNPYAMQEHVWRYRSFPMVDDVWRDLRFAMRSLARTPGFTAIALLVIAAGIGVNTAVFSVVNAVLLKPLTYPDPQSMVEIVTTSDRGSLPLASIPEFNLWQQQTSIFEQVAAYDWGAAGVNLTGGEHPEQVLGVHVTSSYFTLFGASVIEGRTFTTAEDSPNGGRVVVLSYGLWQRRFGGNRSIVGSTIQIDGQPWLVTGILGPNFITDTPADLWIPYQLDLTSQAMVHNFNVAARLKQGITLTQANAQLAVAAGQFRRMFGNDVLPPHGGFGVVSLQESLIGDSRSSLLMLLGAVGFVLLIACANVANLLLARASVRKRELATRAALGAGRGQIIRQLLTESFTLSLTGGLLGLLSGFGGVRLLLSMSPADIPRIGTDGSAVGIDFRVLLFTLGISLATGVLFGLVPAFAASRPNLTSSLNENSSRSGLGFRQGRIRSLLVVSEIGLALVLVMGATLLIRTFLKLQNVDPGFTTHNLLTASMSLGGSRFQKTDAVATIVRDGRARLLAVPGVLDAGTSYCLPLQGCFGMAFDVQGRPKGNSPFTGAAGFFSISPGYFTSLEIPLLRGRVFTAQDDAAAPGVVIINQAMARQYWPKGDPLRDRMQIAPGAGGAFAGEPLRHVIGIVGDTRDAGVSRDPIPTMFIPIAQMPDAETALNVQVSPLWWIVHTRVNPHTLQSAIETALRDACGGLPVAHVRTMAEVEVRNTARQRFNMLLLAIFGAAGLLMAAVGVYGVMSYAVQQRTQELGVRMALGAQASNLRNMVIGQGMLLAGAGLLLGIGASFWLTHFLASLLFQVKAWDPVTFLVTPLVLAAVALCAVWIPAQRATRVDPITALRLE